MPMYRIFIVEDDPGLAEGIAQMVRAWGMDARIAGDFRRVAQEFAEYQPHLAVLFWTSPCPSSTATIGARRSASSPRCPCSSSPRPRTT